MSSGLGGLEDNTYIISSPVRTASTWIYNVAKELLLESGKTVVPETFFKTPDEWVELYNYQARFDCDKDTVYLLKDLMTNPVEMLPRVKIITGVRNPFHICSSFYQFSGGLITNAVNYAKAARLFFDHYAKADPKRVFIYRYEEMEKYPDLIISDLAVFLGVKVSLIKVRSIREKFSRDQVAGLISDLEANPGSPNVSLSGKSRKFDEITGFQSGHISKISGVDWRSAVPAHMVSVIEDELTPVAESLGYNLN